jgi:hypothetical protein
MQLSGLLGVSGISNDMRALLASDHPHAQEAIDLLVYRTRREIGSLAAEWIVPANENSVIAKHALRLAYKAGDTV